MQEDLYLNIYRQVRDIVDGKGRGNIYTNKATAYDNPFKNCEFIVCELDAIDACIEDQNMSDEVKLDFFNNYEEKITNRKFELIKTRITTGVVDDKRTHRAMDFLNIKLVEQLEDAMKEEEDNNNGFFSVALSTSKVKQSLRLLKMFVNWKLKEMDY